MPTMPTMSTAPEHSRDHMGKRPGGPAGQPRKRGVEEGRGQGGPSHEESPGSEWAAKVKKKREGRKKQAMESRFRNRIHQNMHFLIWT